MSRAQRILDGLGGRANIVDVEPCITRLRVEVADQDLVDEPDLAQAGALGVVRSGRIIQVILGPDADEVAGELAGLRELPAAEGTAG